MIIVSQNKTIILLLEPNAKIGINKRQYKKNQTDILVKTPEIKAVLGTYESEKRAKEIIQEMVDEYKKCYTNIDKTTTVKSKTYQMPKE